MNTINDIRKPIESQFFQFENLYETTLRSENKLLNSVLDYIAAKRGKQLRPILVLLSAELCHGITDKTVQTAVALELLHTASLIHDDVVDSSPLRRGSEAIQEKWTNKIAVLSGDWILSKVIEITSDIRNNKILNIVASIGKNLSSGELLQLHSGQSMWISEKQYFEVIRCKTAELFSACTSAGAASSGATMRQESSLRDFGRELGIIFQLKDDILDYSDSEELGKPTMNDIRDGKATLPLLKALERAPEEERKDIEKKAEELASSNNKLSEKQISGMEQDIKTFVMRYDGVRYAYNKMLFHREKAIKALDLFHNSPAKESLINLLDFAINRIN